MIVFESSCALVVGENSKKELQFTPSNPVQFNLNCSGFFLMIFFVPGKYSVLREFVVF